MPHKTEIPSRGVIEGIFLIRGYNEGSLILPNEKYRDEPRRKISTLRRVYFEGHFNV